MKKRLILGDIHGHFDFVRDIYDIENPDEVICLGDYVDSFEVNSKDVQLSLKSLLKLQAQHNKKSKGRKFHLLIGNHDFHYVAYNERYSGYKEETRLLCETILHDAINSGDIEIAYIDEINNTIYSHAGVSQTWFDNWLNGSIENIHTVNVNAFKYTYGDRFDSTGDNKYSSPIWIRPMSLGNDMLKNSNGEEWRQVVGHTRTKGVIDFNDYVFTNNKEHVNLILCDSLPFEYMVEYIDDDGKLINYEIKKYSDFNELYRQ